MILNVVMLYSKAFESIENTKIFSIVTLKFKDKGIQNQNFLTCLLSMRTQENTMERQTKQLCHGLWQIQ
jgi:hypothetical protein